MMAKLFRLATFTVFGVLLLAGGASATTLVKSPDLGGSWTALSSGGSYVYANSFVAPTTGAVTELGTWLNGGSSSVMFEVLTDDRGRPNGAGILASTAALSFDTVELTFENAAPSSSATLVSGHTYWFAISTVGLGGSGGYTAGGHTQNSGGIIDNGTFWYSNDPVGLNFNGRNLNPELAFSVSVNAVPEPLSLALLGTSLVGLGLSRRR